MSLEVYVGNYPSQFTNQNILYLFQDFAGVEIVRSIRKEHKCFLFLKCCDKEQVVDVVTTLHDIDVCGRNLIVRAADEKLQKAILVSLQENDVLDKHPKNKHHSFQIKSYSHASHKQESDASVEHPASDDTEFGVRFKNPKLNLKLHKKQGTSMDPDKELDYPDDVACSSNFSQGRNSKYHSLDELNGSKNVADPKNELEYSASLNHSDSGRNSISPKPNYKNSDHDLTEDYTDSGLSSGLSSNCHPDSTNLFYVSVVNFPFRTTDEDIFELFEDFNPCDVVILCNLPSREQTFTEAIVVFEYGADATDAILMLDNITYRNRRLIVTDATDAASEPDQLCYAAPNNV